MSRDYKYICQYCGVISQDNKLPVCGQCKQYRYCSIECQKKHWYEGGHKDLCNSIKRDNNIIEYIETLTTRIDDLTRLNNDLSRRVCDLEGLIQNNNNNNKWPIEDIDDDDDDYVKESYIELSRLSHKEHDQEYADVEEVEENSSCYGCELMKNDYTGRFYPNHHNCM